MNNYWFMVIRYMVAPEDSRQGFQDYWRSSFLARHTHFGRVCLEVSKVVFLFALYFGILGTMSHF